MNNNMKNPLFNDVMTVLEGLMRLSTNSGRDDRFIMDGEHPLSKAILAKSFTTDKHTDFLNDVLDGYGINTVKLEWITGVTQPLHRVIITLGSGVTISDTQIYTNTDNVVDKFGSIGWSLFKMLWMLENKESFVAGLFLHFQNGRDGGRNAQMFLAKHEELLEKVDDEWTLRAAGRNDGLYEVFYSTHNFNKTQTLLCFTDNLPSQLNGLEQGDIICFDDELNFTRIVKPTGV